LARFLGSLFRGNDDQGLKAEICAYRSAFAGATKEVLG
jgi:hypothetical protein